MARTSKALLLLVGFALLSPVPLLAGIGDLVKSAKDKAAKMAGKKDPAAAGGNVAFDETTLELTPELLDRLIACRKEANAHLEGHPEALRRAAAIQKEMGDLQSKHGGEFHENHNQRSAVLSCIEGDLQELRNRKLQQEAARLMSDANEAAKLAKITLAIQEAQAKGDTAEAARLGRQVDSRYAASPADSAAALRKCGPLPALHPAQVRLNHLQSEQQDLFARTRRMEEKALAIQVEKCGMKKEQIEMAWERIKFYLARSDHKGTPPGFTPGELKALGDRKDALEAAAGV